VFERADRHAAPFRLVELASGVSLDDVKALTTAAFTH